MAGAEPPRDDGAPRDAADAEVEAERIAEQGPLDEFAVDEVSARMSTPASTQLATALMMFRDRHDQERPERTARAVAGRDPGRQQGDARHADGQHAEVDDEVADACGSSRSSVASHGQVSQTRTPVSTPEARLSSTFGRGPRRRRPRRPAHAPTTAVVPTPIDMPTREMAQLMYAPPAIASAAATLSPAESTVSTATSQFMSDSRKIGHESVKMAPHRELRRVSAGQAPVVGQPLHRRPGSHAGAGGGVVWLRLFVSAFRRRLTHNNLRGHGGGGGSGAGAWLQGYAGLTPLLRRTRVSAHRPGRSIPTAPRCLLPAPFSHLMLTVSSDATTSTIVTIQSARHDLLFAPPAHVQVPVVRRSGRWLCPWSP